MEEETWFVEDGRRRGVDVFWLLIGEESWEGERHWGPERGDFFCSLDSKTCSPKTKLKMDGTHQSLPYILASVIASDSALCIIPEVSLFKCEFVDGILYVYILFCNGFEQSSSGRKPVARNEHVLCFSVPGSGACDQSRIC